MFCSQIRSVGCSCELVIVSPHDVAVGVDCFGMCGSKCVCLLVRGVAVSLRLGLEGCHSVPLPEREARDLG